MAKILMVAPTAFFSNYGSSVRIKEECDVLLDAGFNLRICTYKKGSSPAKLPVYRIPFTPNKLKIGASWHRIYLDGMLCSSVLIHSMAYSPDVIHAHLHEGIFCSVPTRLFANIPVIADLQDSILDELIRYGFIKSNSMPSKVINILERTLVNCADFVVCSSPSLYSLLKKKFGPKCALLPDCVDTEKFSPQPKKLDIMQKFRVPKNRKIVVYLGTLSKIQGTDILLRAIYIVLKKYQNVHFVIMGFPNVEKYKLLANIMHISDHVTFTGEVNYDEAPHFLSVADIAVAPKLHTTESNGKVLLYMAMGLPTVVFDNPINHFFLGELGIYAKREDSVSLAEAILRALQVTPNRDLSLNLRNRALTLFSKQVFQKQLLEIYRKILNQT